MSVPQSTVYICSGVRLNSRYEHSIYFASASAQASYFAGKVVKTYTAYTFLRKSWPLKVEATMEQAKAWSYLFFQNGGTGKTYYYFINNIEYINDQTVELTLELDVLQTYLFDITLLPCFVERNHTPNDVIGAYMADEDVELGELIPATSKELGLSDLCIMIASTIDLENIGESLSTPATGGMIAGVYSGLGLFRCLATDAADLSNTLKALDQAGKTDAIVAMWMFPKDLIEITGNDIEATCRPVTGRKSAYTSTKRPDNLAGYVPRNKKLLTYPFLQLYITNNSGSAAAYRFECFGDVTACQFRIIGSLGADANVRCYPLNYQGVQHAYEYGVTIGDFPSCAWASDTYKIWVAQNQDKNTQALVTGGAMMAGSAVAAIAGGISPLAWASAGAAGASQIAGLLAQKHDMSVQPPQGRGSSSSNVNVAANMHTFTLQTKCVRPYQARIIDDYLSMYGYAIKRVQVPNICARQNWTYVKTMGCHIAADLCNDDVTKIEGIFDHGITFWRDGDNLGNYGDDLENYPLP